MNGPADGKVVAGHEHFLRDNVLAMDTYANLGSIAKVLRYCCSRRSSASAGYLVVIEQASGRNMVASSIMMGPRARAIRVALGSWKQLAARRQALTRLRRDSEGHRIAECSGGRTGAPPARSYRSESRRCRARHGRVVSRTLLLPESLNGAALLEDRARQENPRHQGAGRQSGPQRAEGRATYDGAAHLEQWHSTISGGTSAISRKPFAVRRTVADNTRGSI